VVGFNDPATRRVTGQEGIAVDGVRNEDTLNEQLYLDGHNAKHRMGLPVGWRGACLLSWVGVGGQR
jgi:hypothetical protein